MWQSVPSSPLAPPLGELAAKPTERVKIALSASGTSPKGRGKAVEKPCHCEPVLTLAWQSP